MVFNFITQFKIDGIMFLIWSSLFFISNFFSWSFCKSYKFFLISPFNYNIVFIFYVNFEPHSFKKKIPCTKLIFFFNFIIQLNIRFILYFNFDLYSFNFYFLKSFLYDWNYFQFHPSIYDWLRIRLHDFSRLSTLDLTTRVMTLNS